MLWGSRLPPNSEVNGATADMAHSDRTPSTLPPTDPVRLWEPLKIDPPGNGELIGGPGVTIGYYPQFKSSFSNQRSDHVQMLFSLEGTAGEVSWQSAAGKKRCQAVQGDDLFLIAARVRHTLRWPLETEIMILYLAQSCLSQFEPLLVDDVRLESVAQTIMHDPLIGGLIATLGRELRSRVWIEDQIAALGYCLVTRLILALTTRTLRPRKYQRKLSAVTMERVAAYVEANLAERIDFKRLAREASLSVSHFGVLFKNTLGMTPEHFVLNARLMKAKDLLATGHYTVGQVAYRTGFSDHSHLSVQFKRRFGAPPKAYLPNIRLV